MLPNQFASQAARDLGLSIDPNDDVGDAMLTPEQRRKRKQAQTQENPDRAGGIAPFMGAYSALMNKNGNQY